MTTIPNLWPSDVGPSVTSPVAILRAQAGFLPEQTGGILTAEVETTVTEDQVSHRFILVAPALDMDRHVLLEARHSKTLPYPVEVHSPYGKSRVETVLGPPRANSDAEFVRFVGDILGSGAVKAMMTSLVARSNDLVLADGGEAGQVPVEKQPATPAGPGT